MVPDETGPCRNWNRVEIDPAWSIIILRLFFESLRIYSEKFETDLDQLAFLTLCDQAFNPPFLGGKIIELAKFCFMNKRFEPSLSFSSKPMIVSHCV